MGPSVGYIAYIDEAGDDGLQRVGPSDPGAASEWLVLSCLLIKVDREPEVLPWVKTLVGSFNRHQMSHLHFRQLRDDQKLSAAKYLAGLPVRMFAVISNKKNIQGYSNPLAAQAKINVTAWFYVWMTRILLERVTDYCSRKTTRDHGELRTIRFEFASRGGVKIGDVATYFENLKAQDQFGLMYHSAWKPKWDVMNFDEILTFPAKARAGLQLADCVASAFYSALELTAQGIVKPQFAASLLPRMARSKNNRLYGFGLKVWPSYAPTIVTPVQRPLFDLYLPE
jgi:hypothetical protein